VGDADRSLRTMCLSTSICCGLGIGSYGQMTFSRIHDCSSFVPNSSRKELKRQRKSSRSPEALGMVQEPNERELESIEEPGNGDEMAVAPAQCLYSD
jgi:hypothetical protein